MQVFIINFYESSCASFIKFTEISPTPSAADECGLKSNIFVSLTTVQTEACHVISLKVSVTAIKWTIWWALQ